MISAATDPLATATMTRTKMGMGKGGAGGLSDIGYPVDRGKEPSMAAKPRADLRSRDAFRDSSPAPAAGRAGREAGGPPARAGIRRRSSSLRSLIGLAALVAVSVALGLLVTDVLLDAGLARPDERVVESLVAERSASLTDASAVGSMIGGAPVLPILVALVALVSAWMRKWRLAAFAVFVLAAESATYRVTSLVAPRERPHVKRLEDLPADASYPSGHTAAAIAVYAGLVLLITSRYKSGPVRVLAWAIAVAIPVVVALSRMYRGMHHPLDVAGGMVVGIGAAARAALRVSRCRLRRGGARRRPREERPIGPIRPSAGRVMQVAVVAHAAKTLDGGLPELRRVLETAGVPTPLWYEVPKAKKASAQVERALDEGAELVFAWGGDGTVRRCIDVDRRVEGAARRRAGRHRQPVCHQPRHPERHRGGGGDRTARRHAPARRRSLRRASASP